MAQKMSPCSAVMLMNYKINLNLVHGTDIVNVFGRGAEEVLVEIDPLIASQLNLSAQAISQQSIGNADAKVSAGSAHQSI